METRRDAGSVVVACPDARPPAYQAVIGLGRAGLLQRFLTSSYYDPDGPLATLARRLDRAALPAGARPAATARCRDSRRPGFNCPLRRPVVANRGTTRGANANHQTTARASESYMVRSTAGPLAGTVPSRGSPGFQRRRLGGHASSLPAARHPDHLEHGPRRRSRGGRGVEQGGRPRPGVLSDLSG